MVTKYECDKCKALVNRKFTVGIKEGDAYDMYHSKIKEGDFDLCEFCIKKFQAWIKNKVK